MDDLFSVRPRTAGGQYLISLLPSDGGPNVAGRYETTLMIQSIKQEEAYYKTIAHELTHSYDIEHGWLTPEPENIPAPELWHMEGLADFVAFQAVARRAGLTWGSNWTLPQSGHSLNTLNITNTAYEDGYHDAAALVLHFAGQIAQLPGWDWESATDSLALWFRWSRRGCSQLNRSSGTPCVQHEGVYDFMERVMPAGWTPTDGIFHHVISRAADDIWDSAEYFEPHFKADWGEFQLRAVKK